MLARACAPTGSAHLNTRPDVPSGSGDVEQRPGVPVRAVTALDRVTSMIGMALSASTKSATLGPTGGSSKPGRGSHGIG